MELPSSDLRHTRSLAHTRLIWPRQPLSAHHTRSAIATTVQSPSQPATKGHPQCRAAQATLPPARMYMITRYRALHPPPYFQRQLRPRLHALNSLAWGPPCPSSVPTHIPTPGQVSAADPHLLPLLLTDPIPDLVQVVLMGTLRPCREDICWDGEGTLTSPPNPMRATQLLPPSVVQRSQRR